MARQNVILVGDVAQVGQVKDYPVKGTGQTIRKFYVMLDTTTAGQVKAMVEAHDRDGTTRDVPFRGDRIEIHTQAIRNGWASCTRNREYKIVENRGKTAFERYQEMPEDKRRDYDDAKRELAHTQADEIRLLVGGIDRRDGVIWAVQAILYRLEDKTRLATLDGITRLPPDEVQVVAEDGIGLSLWVLNKDGQIEITEYGRDTAQKLRQLDDRFKPVWETLRAHYLKP